MKVARNEKRKKLLGFSFYINIGNFEAFLRNLNLSTKHLFWRCVFELRFVNQNTLNPRIEFDPSLMPKTKKNNKNAIVAEKGQNCYVMKHSPRAFFTKKKNYSPRG